MKLEDINNLQKVGEVQTKLDSYKYYLKFKYGNPRDLAEILFWIIRSQYNTYYGNDKNILQCYGDSRRSFEDIYRVAKYYIKDITLKDIFFNFKIFINTKIFIINTNSYTIFSSKEWLFSFLNNIFE